VSEDQRAVNATRKRRGPDKAQRQDAGVIHLRVASIDIAVIEKKFRRDTQAANGGRL